MTNFNQKGMLDDSIYKEAGDLLAVGGWMIEMPKDGSHPRMYGNRQMHAIFEAPEDLSPEALFDFWFDRIILTFRESREMIRQALAKGQVGRNSCYAWQHPSKGCVFIRARGAGGVSENGNTWHKGLVEVAETEFQFRMPEGKPFKVLEARKLQIYAPYFLETYEEIHEIDPVTLRVTPLSYRQDHYDPRPKDADLYELHRLDLHPEDFERVKAALDKKTLEGIIRDGKELTLQFRVADKLLGWRWVEAKYFAVEYWAVPKILVKTVDVEARRRVRTLELEKRDLVEAMFNIYASVMEVDLTAGMAKFLKSMDWDPQDIPESIQIDRLIGKVAPRIVLASERDNFQSYFDLDNLRRAVACHEHGDCTIRMRSFLKDTEPSLSKYFLIANQEGTEKINGPPDFDYNEDSVKVLKSPKGTTFVIPNTGGTRAYDAIYDYSLEHIKAVRPKLSWLTQAQLEHDDYLFEKGRQPHRSERFKTKHENWRDSSKQNFVVYKITGDRPTGEVYQVSGDLIKGEQRRVTIVDRFEIRK